MSSTNLNVGGYKQITATGNVCPQAGAALLGIFVSTTTAGTITVYDSNATSTATTIVATFTPVAATWYTLPFSASQGLYIVVGGALSATVSFA